MSLETISEQEVSCKRYVKCSPKLDYFKQSTLYVEKKMTIQKVFPKAEAWGKKLISLPSKQVLETFLEQGLVFPFYDGRKPEFRISKPLTLCVFIGNAWQWQNKHAGTCCVLCNFYLT